MKNFKKAMATPSEKKQRLFVDMDGTLAVFTPVDKLETLYQRGYFADLKPIPNVVGAVKQIIRDHPEIEVNILSAHLSDSPYALAEKNVWLDKHLPEVDKAHRIFPPCGRDKASYIPDGLHESDFLLDDYTKNLLQWEPPARGIKLLNGINHTRGTWKKACVRYDEKPYALVAGIVSTMCGETAAQETASDPHIKERTALQEQIEQLELLRQEHDEAQRRTQEKLQEYPRQFDELRSTIGTMTKEYISLMLFRAAPLQIEEIENNLIAVKEEARRVEKKMEHMRLLLENPFKQAGELEEATARLMKLNAENGQTDGFDHNAGMEPAQTPPPAYEPVMY